MPSDVFYRCSLVGLCYAEGEKTEGGSLDKNALVSYIQKDKTARRGKTYNKRGCAGEDGFGCRQHSAWIQVGVWQRN